MKWEVKKVGIINNYYKAGEFTITKVKGSKFHSAGWQLAKNYKIIATYDTLKKAKEVAENM